MAEKIVKDSQGLAKDLVNDCISRQEAIDAVHKNYDVILDFTSDGQTISSSIEDILSELPSAQPKSYREGYQAGYKDAQSENAKRTAETAQNVSDEDLISRKAAMNRIDEALARVFVDSRGCGESALRKLPSVKLERNRGHWVGIDDEPCETWECDKCGCIQECFEDELPNYCPNCGAEMSNE